MTLRQYCDSDTINTITGLSGANDDRLIAVAEADIDAFCQECMDLRNRNNLQSMMSDSEYDSSEISVAALTLTLPASGTYTINQYQNCVVELLKDSSGLKRGQRISVISSINNILTLDRTIPVAVPVKIYQLGVFPRQADTGKYGKSIPNEIVEAVAWQVAHLRALSSDLAKSVKSNSKKAGLKSESIGSSYSYTLGSGKTDPTDTVCIKSQALINSLL
jgi:hypothetical protein